MKKVELKRISELLRRGGPPDEKTPFAQGGTVPDSGAISKNLEAADDNIKPGKEFPEDEESGKIEGPMGILRKLCFAMSFNVWILYFLMLAWIIPCRNLDCDPNFVNVVETNLDSIWPLTNMETLDVDGLPSLAMFGYADGPTLHLAAVGSDAGTLEWNNTLAFIPRRIQCNFEIMFDANGDGIADCLLTGYNDVYAFNASNGHVFWEQNLPSEDGNIVSRFHPTMERNKLTYLIGSCGDSVVALNAHNGTLVSQVDLPCWTPFDIRIVPNRVSANFTFWSIVCDYEDKVEAWGFGEEDLLNRRNSGNTGHDQEGFTLLFKRESHSGGSIDLGCDVTSIPGGPLFLSWSDRVAMVTPTTTAWERHFPYPLTVASIKVGHFTKSKEFQVAAVVRNSTNSIIYILETANGTTVSSMFLKNRAAQSLKKLPGTPDSLVLMSVVMNFTSYNLTDPMPREKTNFALVEFGDETPSGRNVVTTSGVVGSAVNSKANGERNLLLLKTTDGSATFQRHVIHRSRKDNTFCSGVGHPTHFSSEM